MSQANGANTTSLAYPKPKTRKSIRVTKSDRARIENAITALIDALDAPAEDLEEVDEDGPGEDLEPSLGWTQGQARFGRYEGRPQGRPFVWAHGRASLGRDIAFKSDIGLNLDWLVKNGDFTGFL